jgi:hypothetical protein
MCDTVSEPLPPITIRASSPISSKVAFTRARPSGRSNGLPRLVPSSVPPRGSMPRNDRMSSGIVVRAITPSQASTKPRISSP